MATPKNRPMGAPEASDVFADEEEGTVKKEDSVEKIVVGGPGWESDPNNGLTLEEVEKSLAVHGPNEIPVEITPLYVLFLRQYMGFMPFLIELAAIISLAVQDYVDFAIVAAMLLINGLLGFREEYHAKKSLDELANKIESEVTVLRDGGKAMQLKTTELVPGDVVFLVGGNIVSADIKWLRGDVMSLDTAALTGEPIPRKYPGEHGDVMLSGTTVRAGECYGQVTATGTNTEIGQAQADVMKDKSVKVESVFYRKIMMVVQAVILVSLFLVIAVLLVDGLYYGGFESSSQETILNALSIMIAAIPVALPLVLQVNMALGAAYLAKHHNAIVTSIPALQDIASMSILCSDKTGTLTTAKMSIMSDSIYSALGFDSTDVLLFASLCSNPDKKDDPIDRAVLQALEKDQEGKKRLESMGYEQESIIGFNPEVKRTVGFIKAKDGTKLTIAKGLPAKVLDTSAGGVDSHEIQWKCANADDKKFIKELDDMGLKLSKDGYKTIAIAIFDGDAREVENPIFQFVGLLPMIDPPREDTAQTISSLHRANISVKMITGDHTNVAIETARLIGLGTNIYPGEDIRNTISEQQKNEMIWHADGFASVLPSDKRECVMILRNVFGIVTGMTGDGVNDAPALSAAQVGIAVEGATDAAKNAADLILTEPGLSPIYGAVLESRRIFARIKAYVVYRVAASIMLVLTLSLLMFISGCAVDPLLVIILALLNDISMIPVAYDYADATAKPQLPLASKLVLMSIFFGIVHTGIALLVFYVIDDNDRLDGNFDLSKGPECSTETKAFVWFYLVLATEFMIFSARAQSFFWKSKPSIFLVASVLATALIGSLVAGLAQDLPGSNVGWIWLFNICAFILVDLVKVWFKGVINDSPGDVIEGDGLMAVEKDVSEVKKQMEKKKRYVVHEECVVPLEHRYHTVRVVDKEKGFFGKLFEAVTSHHISHHGFNKKHFKAHPS
jgi:H+-transporting ATPase